VNDKKSSFEGGDDVVSFLRSSRKPKIMPNMFRNPGSLASCPICFSYESGPHSLILVVCQQ